MAASFEAFQLWKDHKSSSDIEAYQQGEGKKNLLRWLIQLSFSRSQFVCQLQRKKEIGKRGIVHYLPFLTKHYQIHSVTCPLDGLVSLREWPPTMYGDLAEYLVQKGERDLRTRLLTNYKEGKADSYFDSKRLREVYYHKIHADSPYCFVKSECCPSMKVSHEMHKVWICIHKKSGKIISAYCSCFAGYVS